jgi:propanol-preferring alcohol dehydrogenase
MCLKCADCTEFGPQFCKSKDFRGFTSDGFFAEYALFDAATAVKVPGEGNMAEIAPILCAGITVWDAITRAAAPRLKQGDWIGVVGCGGLGTSHSKDSSNLRTHGYTVCQGNGLQDSCRRCQRQTT